MFERSYALLDLGLGKGLSEPLRLYTDRKGPNTYNPTLECNVSTRRR